MQARLLLHMSTKHWNMSPCLHAASLRQNANGPVPQASDRSPGDRQEGFPLTLAIPQFNVKYLSLWSPKPLSTSWGRTAPVCLPILFRLSALVRHWGHCLYSRLSGSVDWLGVAYAGQWQLSQDSAGHGEGQLEKRREGEECCT